jgi:serine O-acetyltransferase
MSDFSIGARALIHRWISVGKEDVKAVKDRDPAARGTFEIILSYPGLHAIWMHRLAYYLHEKKVPLLPRLTSMFARAVTGIEIHQTARIGHGLFIDHGMGVVIGETAEVGENVTMYQGVTLGGTGKEKGKRHPSIGNNVVMAAGASVLGPITVGDNSKVGAGAVVLKDVPPNCTVVGVPGRLTVCSGEKISQMNLHHESLPDPLVEMFEEIDRRLEKVERANGSSGRAEPAACDTER